MNISIEQLKDLDEKLTIDSLLRFFKIHPFSCYVAAVSGLSKDTCCLYVPYVLHDIEHVKQTGKMTQIKLAVQNILAQHDTPRKLLEHCCTICYNTPAGYIPLSSFVACFDGLQYSAEFRTLLNQLRLAKHPAVIKASHMMNFVLPELLLDAILFLKKQPNTQGNMTECIDKLFVENVKKHGSVTAVYQKLEQYTSASNIRSFFLGNRRNSKRMSKFFNATIHKFKYFLEQILKS